MAGAPSTSPAGSAQRSRQPHRDGRAAPLVGDDAPATRPAGRASPRSRSSPATARPSWTRRASHLAPGSLTPEVTFLGAHVVPEGVDADSYVALVTGAMLTAVAPHARWVDRVLRAARSTPTSRRAVLLAGHDAGLRLHANQLGHGPGLQASPSSWASRVGKASTYLSDDDIAALAAGDTVATLLQPPRSQPPAVRTPTWRSNCQVQRSPWVPVGTGVEPATSSMSFVIALAVPAPRDGDRGGATATPSSACALRHDNIS